MLKTGVEMGKAKMKPKTYGGTKPFKEIKAAVKKNGWPWNQKKYDAGSDWVTFGFVGPDSRRREVVFCSFNGRFIVKGDGDIGLVTEESTEMDGTPWYDALLDFIYTPETPRQSTEKE
jgi:hypothetical protein